MQQKNDKNLIYTVKDLQNFFNDNGVTMNTEIKFENLYRDGFDDIEGIDFDSKEKIIALRIKD